MSLSRPQRWTSNQPGSWAHDTLSRRIPHEIIPRIIAENSSHEKAIAALRDIQVQLLNNTELPPLHDTGSDHEVWREIITSLPLEERTWQDAPYLIAEFYFYRLVMQAFDYFTESYDPFALEKSRGLDSSLPDVEQLAAAMESSLVSATPQQLVQSAILQSLWGNRSDLSLWPTGTTTSSHSDEHCLVDHTAEVVAHLLNQQNNNISIVVDNAGHELMCDLMLAHTLLTTNTSQTITLHTKEHPTFVSDATTSDVLKTIRFLSHPDCGTTINSRPHTLRLGHQLKKFYDQGRLIVQADLYWCQPIPFNVLPTRIEHIFQASSLVVVKGDANYRRLLEDRRYPYTTPMEVAFGYWTVPMLALRTFKSEVGCGLTDDMISYANERDSNWQFSGAWGLAQFMNTTTSSCKQSI